MALEGVVTSVMWLCGGGVVFYAAYVLMVSKCFDSVVLMLVEKIYERHHEQIFEIYVFCISVEVINYYGGIRMRSLGNCKP